MPIWFKVIDMIMINIFPLPRSPSPFPFLYRSSLVRFLFDDDDDVWVWVSSSCIPNANAYNIHDIIRVSFVHVDLDLFCLLASRTLFLIVCVRPTVTVCYSPKFVPAMNNCGVVPLIVSIHEYLSTSLTSSSYNSYWAGGNHRIHCWCWRDFFFVCSCCISTEHFCWTLNIW